MPTDYSYIGFQNLLNDQQFQAFVDHYIRSEESNINIKEFLSLFDAFAKKHLSSPTSLRDSLIAWESSPLKSIDRIKTGKAQVDILQFSVKRTLIALLCVLVGTGSRVYNMQEIENGFILRATVPADIWSFEGDAHISILSQGNGTKMKAIAEIKGQLYDWGKTKRWLNKLFINLKMLCGRMQ